MSASTDPKTKTEKAKIKRKAAKRYTRVSFELDAFEGTFDLPSFKEVPTGVQRRSMRGDLDALVEFLEANSSAAVVSAFDDMDQDEAGDFMEAWAAASDLDLGK